MKESIGEDRDKREAERKRQRGEEESETEKGGGEIKGCIKRYG